MKQRSFTAALLCVAAGVVASDASPQSLRQGEFSVQRFLPPPGSHNFITVEGARTDGKMALSFGAWGNYSNSPFTVQVKDFAAGNIREVKVVRDVFTVDLVGAITFVPRLQLGFRVPYTSVVGDGLQVDPNSPTAGFADVNGLKGKAVGDPMLELKWRAVGLPQSRWVLGVSTFSTAPTAKKQARYSYIGDESWAFGGRAIMDALFGRVRVGLNAGGLWRDKGTLGVTTLGSELRYGAAASFKITPIIYVLAEGFGATKLSSQTGTSSLEADGALQLMPMSGHLSVMAGGGAGLLSGVGSPAYRAFLGLSWNNEIQDRDGDGIPDDIDQCPNEPEDFDGYQDEDGCPDPDNDGDGIPDNLDKCPNEPETKNGYLDDDGCPDDVPDRDGDGIPDVDDKCPDEGGPNVIRRRGPWYGCPDRDHDGIPDKVDKCPDEPEDFDGFEDEDGCPDPDNDQDGILDVDDECPDQAETYNGIKDDDGCPDGPALVTVAGDHLKFEAPVNFVKDLDTIGPKSVIVMEATSNLLRHHTEMLKLEVMVHAESGAKKDEALATRRARATKAFLASHGVDASRVTAVGGAYSVNRIEIKIVEKGKRPVEAPPEAAPSAPASAPAATPAPKPATPIVDDGFDLDKPAPPAAAPAEPAAPAKGKKGAAKKGAKGAAPATAPKPGGGTVDLGDL
jgi:OmpA-OmpF porin, OOP family